VRLWERLVEENEKTGELLVDLGSDQTSCHNPYNGGYYPVQLEYEEAQEVQYLTDLLVVAWLILRP
jgi:urocanate hydratase